MKRLTREDEVIKALNNMLVKLFALAITCVVVTIFTYGTYKIMGGVL